MTLGSERIIISQDTNWIEGSAKNVDGHNITTALLPKIDVFLFLKIRTITKTTASFFDFMHW